MTKHYADDATIDRARRLRIDSTEAERRLWNILRNRQLEGFKFRREHPVSGYFLDFACEESKLAIELDGGQHNEQAAIAYDARRTATLQQSGWRVLRFWNNEVMENMEGVYETIVRALTRNHEG